MIKVILFDVDQVLVNTSGMYFSKHLEEDYGISTDLTKEFFLGDHQECIIGKKDLRELLPIYMERWGWKGTLDELLAYWYKSEHFLNDELIEEIKIFRKNGLKLYLATNQDKYRVEYILNEMGFGKLVDGHFASSHVGYKKPEKEYFISILERLKEYDPQEILFWDDNKENVEAARALSINAEHYINYLSYKDIMKKKYSL